MTRLKYHKQMDSKQPVNFYFGGLDKSGIIGSTDSTDKTSTNYIIFQNDCLHKRVKELENEISDLNRQNTELEDDNGSLETSKTNLKGYVQNQGEYNKLSKNLVEIYDNAITGFDCHRKHFEQRFKIFCLRIIILQICLLFYRLYSYSIYDNIYGILEMIIINYIIIRAIMEARGSYNEFISIKDIKHYQSVTKIKGHMKEASKGNDYLTELIDKL